MIKQFVKTDKLTKIFTLILLTLFLMVMFNGIRPSTNFPIYEKVLQNFSTIFISIILEAIPFIMLGAFISALIQVYIPQEAIVKIIPKNKFLGVLTAALMGFFFPICECAIIPIAKRLIKKGVPVSAATTFMLAVPIVNPVVLVSTYYAFFNKPEVVLLRCVLGLIGSMVIGYIVGYNKKLVDVLKDSDYEDSMECYCGCGNPIGYHRNKSKFNQILEHTNSELYNIGKYLIFGAFISASFQTFVPQNAINPIGNHLLYSILVMLGLAFVMSICSSADAFIAKAFLSQFTLGSVVAFLVLGPMLDIKNTLMLSSSYKKKYVLDVIIYVFFICFVIGCFVNVLMVLNKI